MTQKTNSNQTKNIILWIAQGFLAASFIWAGSMKLFLPAEKLAEMWPWTAEYPTLVLFTGIIDILGGFGIVLPTLLRVQAKWAAYTAYSMIVLMIAASAFHIARGESMLIGINIAFTALAVFVAWGRRSDL